MSYKAVVITKPGGYSVLAVQPRPIMEPGHGEVRVRVMAAGLNFAEVSARMGIYPDAPPTPSVVGYEVAGIIDACGEDVDDSWHVGQRVICFCKFGGHAEMVVVPSGNLWALPEVLSFEEGAAVPVNFLTAYHMLYGIGVIRPKSVILVHMAAGGVGTAAIQLIRAKCPDAYVYGTASASKHAFLKELGYDCLVDYRKEDYQSVIRELEWSRRNLGTVADNKKRVSTFQCIDVVLDALGGDDWRKGAELLKPIGRIVMFGFANGSSGATRSYFTLLRQYMRIPKWSSLAMLDNNMTVQGVNMGHLFGDEEMSFMRTEMSEVMGLLSEKKVRPILSAYFGFEQAGEAHRFMQERKNIGKVLLIPLGRETELRATNSWLEGKEP